MSSENVLTVKVNHLGNIGKALLDIEVDGNYSSSPQCHIAVRLNALIFKFLIVSLFIIMQNSATAFRTTFLPNN